MSTALQIYENFTQTRQIAETLSRSDLIPPHFYQKPANVIIALEFAHRNDIPPFQAMQSLYVVHGKMGMTASMAIALARKANVWRSLKFNRVGSGDSLEVTAVATLHDGETVEATVSYDMAKKAGWTKNQTYNSIPEQMLKYRAAVFLIRTHFPEALFGMQTVEELEDVAAAKAKPVVPVIQKPVPVIDVPKKETETNEVNEYPNRFRKDYCEPEQDQKNDIETISGEPVEEELERDIEDIRGELREFLTTRENVWFEKIGKSRGDMMAKIENETSLDKMQHFYKFVQQIGG